MKNMCSWTVALLTGALVFATLATFVYYEPYASKIVDVNNGLRLDGETLRQILFQEEIKEKKVCVISIAGALRQGKSFLFNFFLRYLRLTSARREHLQKWLSPKDGPVAGFSWRGGSDTVTSGILIWPELFVRQLPSGEEVVVVLMDTQGSFDNESTMRHCAAVFALSTLVSSVQIYNLKDNMKNSDLTHLQFFLSYGQLLKEAGDEHPFQNLMFLIRDWATPEQYPYGLGGGELLLKKVLNTNDTKLEPEVLALRKGVTELFEDIKCYLMPHPGLKVTKLGFKGQLEDIDEEFKKYVEALTTILFAPENLIPKTVSGEYLKVKHLADLFEYYCEQFKSQDMPEVESLLKATANAQQVMVLEQAETKYDEAMAFMKNDDFEGMDDADLAKEHQMSKNIALGYFRGKKIIGGEEMKEQNAKALEQKLDEKFNTVYKILNHFASDKAKLPRMHEELSLTIKQLSIMLEKQEMKEKLGKATDEQKEEILQLRIRIEQAKLQLERLEERIKENNRKFQKKTPITKIIDGVTETLEGVYGVYEDVFQDKVKGGLINYIFGFLRRG